MWKKGTLKRIKKTLFGIMLLFIVLYAANAWLLHQKMDSDGPVITFEEEILEVSINVSDEELLSGVRAEDKKDGDVSEYLMIESMSGLLSDNQRIVTYVAFDKDNHVGKAERRIQYTDYTSPRFSLSEPLNMAVSSMSSSNVLESLHATDCIDGDLTDQIIITNTEVEGMSLEAVTGFYEVQVTNSCGDMASLKLPIKMNLSAENTYTDYAKIELTEYLTYCKAGEVIEPEAYVKSAWIGEQEYEAGSLQIDSAVDIAIPGVYTITYSIQENEAGASVDLIVVVEE